MRRFQSLHRRSGALALVVPPLLLIAAGCNKPPKAGDDELPAPVVTVAAPIQQSIIQYEYATGRAEPTEEVKVRAQVSGYLKDVLFEPGTEVEADVPIAQIDPEPFQADLDRAEAVLATANADLLTAEAELSRSDVRVVTTKKEYDRAEVTLRTMSGSVADRDKAKGEYDEATVAVRAAKAKIELAKAKIKEAEAAVRTAQLNLGYCKIVAPIAGAIGDRLVTRGNLITANMTIITTVVSVEKMDIAFDVDENTLERVQQAIREGKIKLEDPDLVPVEAGLALHGVGFPLRGVINFRDNRVDPRTGTIRMKARFDNPKPGKAPRMLAAGMFTRVRVPMGKPVASVLVPDAALGSDQGTKFIYVVGPDNKATRLDATVGPLEGTNRVIESVRVPGQDKSRALTASDRVIVNGLQRVRPGLTVEPKLAGK